MDKQRRNYPVNKTRTVWQPHRHGAAVRAERRRRPNRSHVPSTRLQLQNRIQPMTTCGDGRHENKTPQRLPNERTARVSLRAETSGDRAITRVRRSSS